VASSQPCLVIVAGPNGSGKSTFALEAAGTALLLGTTAINPDDLTKSAMREQPKLELPAANILGVERAEKSVWRAIAENSSVAIETVLSSNKFLPTLMRHTVVDIARVWSLWRYQVLISQLLECRHGCYLVATTCLRNASAVDGRGRMST
jgi:predicted ATP-binding protein involved in virulence